MQERETRSTESTACEYQRSRRALWERDEEVKSEESRSCESRSGKSSVLGSLLHWMTAKNNEKKDYDVGKTSAGSGRGEAQPCPKPQNDILVKSPTENPEQEDWDSDVSSTSPTSPNDQVPEDSWELDSANTYRLFYLILLVEQRLEHVRKLIKTTSEHESSARETHKALTSVETDLSVILVNLKRLREKDQAVIEMLKWGEDVDAFFTNVETICQELDGLWKTALASKSEAKCSTSPRKPRRGMRENKQPVDDYVAPFTFNTVRCEPKHEVKMPAQSLGDKPTMVYEYKTVPALQSDQFNPLARQSTPHPLPEGSQRSNVKCRQQNDGAGDKAKHYNVSSRYHDDMDTPYASEEVRRREVRLTSLMSEIDTLLEQVSLSGSVPNDESPTRAGNLRPKNPISTRQGLIYKTDHYATTQLRNPKLKSNTLYKHVVPQKDEFIEEFDKLLESFRD